VKTWDVELELKTLDLKKQAAERKLSALQHGMIERPADWHDLAENVPEHPQGLPKRRNLTRYIGSSFLWLELELEVDPLDGSSRDRK
jgi:hypothetical protein